MVLHLEKRNQVSITVAGNDKYPLVRVLHWIWVGENVNQSTAFDSYNHALERDPKIELELFVLCRAPPERLRAVSLIKRVPFLTKGARWQAAKDKT